MPLKAALFGFIFALVVLTIATSVTSSLLAACGPFTDVAADPFCPLVLEIFYLGITTGTTPTTYDPTASVSRLQMAAFLSRTVDKTLQRGSPRAAQNRFWTAHLPDWASYPSANDPRLPASDGPEAYVACFGDGTVKRFSAGMQVLGTWTGAANAFGVVVTPVWVFVTKANSPGSIYYLYRGSSGGSVSTLPAAVGAYPVGIAFDGSSLWTANTGGSVSIVTLGVGFGTTVTAGFVSPVGALYDGANVWVTDQTAGTLLKLDGAGGVLQTVTVGASPRFAVFDGVNIWVPNGLSNSVSVVRASSGAVLATLTGNGLGEPFSAAFDGQQVLVTNHGNGNDGVSFWKAADLSPLGSQAVAGSAAFGACSDGANFWVTMPGKGAGTVYRF